MAMPLTEGCVGPALPPAARAGWHLLRKGGAAAINGRARTEFLW
jgi:hypothetical protein